MEETVDALAGRLGAPLGTPVGDLLEAVGTRRSRVGFTAALQHLLEDGSGVLMGAAWATITTGRQGRLHTLVASRQAVAGFDAIQNEHGDGPTVDVLSAGRGSLATADLARDGRWQPVGRRLAEEVGVRSLVAHRLDVRTANAAPVALVVGADRPNAFDEEDRQTGLVLAAHLGLLLEVHHTRKKATELGKALESNREIGIAVGVIMARAGLTREAAFEVLRRASQDTNTKLAVLATRVADTGVVPGEGAR